MAGVIERVFTIEHNRLDTARQEYELAKEHYAEVLKLREPGRPDHQQRFADAQERLERGREAYLTAFCK
jgi:hypothetical protein